MFNSFKSEYSSNVFSLMSGTVLAQVLPILFIPIISRVFVPSDLGVFAVFQSFTMVAAVMATLRYSYALLLPESDTDAFNLLVFCCSISALLALLLLAILPFRNQIALIFGSPSLAQCLGWIPLAALFNGLYASMYSWANRKKKYRQMAFSKVLQSLGITICALGLVKVTPDKTSALLGGYFIGQLISIFALSNLILDCVAWKSVSFKRIIFLGKRYKDFPIYSLPGGAINAVSGQSPPILISLYFGESVAGLYSLTYRAILGPLMMITKALLDVFKERAARDFGKMGNCAAIFNKTFKNLALVAVPFTFGLMPFAPKVFSLVFGEEWREAGVYAQFLLPMFCLKFIGSPLSFVTFVAEKQKADMFWQIGMALSVVTSFVLGGKTGNINLALSLFSVSSSILYIIYIWMNYSFSKGLKRTTACLLPHQEPAIK